MWRNHLDITNDLIGSLGITIGGAFSRGTPLTDGISSFQPSFLSQIRDMANIQMHLRQSAYLDDVRTHLRSRLFCLGDPFL